ncbi:hypothetical protein B0H11DRAFT_2045082 [Mycena galericulata]|nr:hypothetical protein B0H11DRAFT_2045082 [Mycena galericulata]
MREFVLRLGLLTYFYCSFVYADPSSSSTMDLTRTFFTPEDDALPAPQGTFIATGVLAVTQLAEYLDTYPETRIMRVLVSDSTVEDTETGHGYVRFTEDSGEDGSDFLFDVDGYQWGRKNPKPLTDEEEDRIEDIRHSNAKTDLRLKRAVRDLEAPLKRILDKAAPSLEAFSYLNYIYRPWKFPITNGAEDPRIAALLGHDYPKLREFTFRNQDMEGVSRLLIDSSSQFHSVTHLHVPNLWPTLTSILKLFPQLTHLLLTGVESFYGLPSEFHPVYPTPGWTFENLKRSILGTPYDPPKPLPGNVTVIIQPDFNPMFAGGFCGTPGVAYNEMFDRLGDDPRAHVKFPIEEDYRSGLGLVPLRRAIKEFEDRARGAQGEWAIPESVPDRDQWWWNKRSNDTKADDKAGDEL